jgi:hypothetical protein
MARSAIRLTANVLSHKAGPKYRKKPARVEIIIVVITTMAIVRRQPAFLRHGSPCTDLTVRFVENALMNRKIKKIAQQITMNISEKVIMKNIISCFYDPSLRKAA